MTKQKTPYQVAMQIYLLTESSVSVRVYLEDNFPWLNTYEMADIVFEAKYEVEDKYNLILQSKN